jgi:hypothetical protein
VLRPESAKSISVVVVVVVVVFYFVITFIRNGGFRIVELTD